MLERFRKKIKEEWESLKDAILVSPEEAERRISICEECPTGNFSLLSRRCKICTCFMDVKTKLKIFPGDPLKEMIHCPQGHWEQKPQS